MGSKIVTHFNPDGIPEYLKQRPQWIVWGKRTKPFQNALLDNGKLNRIPFNPRTGKVALSDDPKSWGTWEQVILAYQSGWYNGIGFMLAENDGLVAIILNHCFLIGTKKLLPEAEQILARFDTTFAEIFPSGNRRGDGLHIYCFGLASRCGKGEHAQWIELCGKDITGRRTNRYICVTGHQFSKTREITNCQPSLSWLYRTFKLPAIPAITYPVLPTRDNSSRREKNEVSKAQPANEGSQNDQRLKPASALNQQTIATAVNGSDTRAKPKKTLKHIATPAKNTVGAAASTVASPDDESRQHASDVTEAETALLNVTTLPRRDAQPTIATAVNGNDTRVKPKKTLKHIATPAKSTVGAAVSSVASPDNECRQRTFPFTDLGNAERFVHLYGDQLRYCQQNKSWYIWDGRRWERDQKMQAMGLVHNTVRSILNDATNTRLSKEQAKLANNYARKSENTTRMKAILEHARPKLSIVQNELDAHPMLLNVKNGVVDLKTGHLLPHNPKLLLSQIANTAFVKTAACPRWLAFVDWCFRGDQYLIDFVQKGIGYSIAGEIREQNFFVLYGDSDNGKSTFINVIRLLLGDYGYAAPHTLVIKQRHEGHPTELAALKGRRIVTVSETHKNAPLNIRRMKDLTNRTMTARFMGGNFFEFSQSHTIWIDSNHRPVINDPNDAGIWKRVKPIPFLNRIARKDRDINLEEKLLAEAPGILSWLVDGCVAYQRKGLAEPPIVVKAKRDYKGEGDVIGAFLEDCCRVDDPNAVISTTLLFKAYQNWCAQNNLPALSNIVFGKEMVARKFEKKKSNRVRHYVGIQLVVNE
jgi:putative DNA primase/helicase